VETATAVSSRGTGVLDMARAIRAGRPHRADGALAYHVLDTMLAVAESVEARQFVTVDSTIEIPALLPDDWDPKASTV
jgi:predicted dehydrogenase